MGSRSLSERSVSRPLQGGMSNADLREIGEMLGESEVALIVIGVERRRSPPPSTPRRR